MSDIINDGGPAFPPQVVRDGDGLLQEVTAYGMQSGMALRDYFAAKAMQGAFTSFIESTAEGKHYIARHSYEMADAMLAARGTK